MSARIISFAEAFARKSKGPMRAIAEQSGLNQQPDLMQRFLFWKGASGTRYVHTVYSLLDCPPLTTANYILVSRTPEGRRSVLAIGRLAADSPSLNLADLRHRGARLGANEVHIHLLAESGRDSQKIEFDLKAGHLDDTVAASWTQH